MEIIELIVILILPLLLLIGISFRRSRKAPLNLPPGTFGWPFLGESIDYLRAHSGAFQDKFIKNRVERYGSNVFKTFLFGQPIVFLCGPAGNKFVFTNDGRKLRNWAPAHIRKLTGLSLVSKIGNEGRIRRKHMMAGFFNADTLKKSILAMDEITRVYFRTHWQEKEEVMVRPLAKVHTFEVACRVMLDIKQPDLISRLLTQFNMYLEGMTAIPLNLPGISSSYKRGMRAAEMIRRELRVLVRHRMAEQEHKTPPGQDILSYMLVKEDENGMIASEEDIINEILNLLFAGHNTLVSALCLIIKYLNKLPRVHEKVLEEQTLIAISKAPGELLTWEDLQKMKYSWNVISEIMRLAPPVAGTFRETLDDLTVEGYTIPKGWKVSWSAAYTHKDSSCHWNETDFDESRFEGAGMRPFSYVPFGGGPRMCLGKEFARFEILVFLHNLINRFDWDLINPDEKFSYAPLLVPEKGLPIRLRPRNFSD